MLLQRWLLTLAIMGMLGSLLAVGSGVLFAGSYEPCAIADQGQPAGGCTGCFIISEDTNGMDTVYFQGSCTTYLGDGQCPSTYWGTIPSPGCYGETTSCGSGTKYFVTSDNQPANGPTCGLYLGDTINTVSQYCYDNELTQVSSTGQLNCLANYWKVIDQTSTVNCSAP